MVTGFGVSVPPWRGPSRQRFSPGRGANVPVRSGATSSTTVRRRTSTTTCSAPSFRTLILLDPGAASASRAGETERATRGAIGADRLCGRGGQQKPGEDGKPEGSVQRASAVKVTVAE